MRYSPRSTPHSKDRRQRRESRQAAPLVERACRDDYSGRNVSAARAPLSVLVTTFNEVDQIEDCLRSVTWADEVFLVDSFSTDTTVDLVRERFPAVNIEQRPYYGAGPQKNYAIPRLRHDWVLVVDADERVTDELRQEIESVLQKPEHNAYRIGRRNFMLGREVSYGGMQRDYVTRLFNRQFARYENRRVHAELEVDGTTGTLRQKYLHNYIRSFEHMIRKMTNYGVWGAANAFRRGERGHLALVLAHPFWRFLRDYIFWRGFLDGSRGVLLAGIHTYYTFWKYAKLWEYTELERQGKPLHLPEFDTEVERSVDEWKSRRAAATVKGEPRI